VLGDVDAARTQIVVALSAFRCHPLALMCSALSADTASHTSSVGPMLEVVSVHGVESGIQCSRPELEGRILGYRLE
jgi:hypothetical protein